MALREPIQPFVFGPGGRRMTPEQVAREREVASAMMKTGADFSPVGHWLAGAARAAQAGVGALKERWADEAEQAGMDGARDKYGPQIAALLGGGQPAAIDPVAEALVGAPETASDATAAMAMGGQPQAPTGDWMGLASTLVGKGEVPDRALIQEYLANGGVNLDPATTAWCAAFVNATLGQQGIEGTGSNMARSFLNYGEAVDQPQRGDLAVFSRGDPNGPFGHVGFFDALNPDGTIRVLGGNQSNAVGYSNYGADNLLGYRRIPGAGGTSSPAQSGGVPTTQPGGSAAAIMEALSDPWARELYGPGLETAFAQQIQQQDPRYQQQLAMGDLQMQQARLEIEALLNPHVEAPKPIEVGGVLLDPTTYQPIFDSRAPAEAPKPIEVGGVLLDPVTFQPVFDSRSPSDTGFTLSPGEQRFDAQGNPIASAAPAPADGPKPIEVGGVLLDPVTFQPVFDSRQPDAPEPFTLSPGQQRFDGQGNPIAASAPEPGFTQLTPAQVSQNNLDPTKAWQAGPDGRIYEIGGGGVTVNTGNMGEVGTIPPDYELITDPVTGARSMRVIPGSPSDIKAREDAKAAASQSTARDAITDTAGTIVAQDIDRAITLVDKPGLLPTTGFGANWLNNIGGTDGNDLRNLLNTVKANTAFDQLQQMRDASPTGGALGGVSAPELTLLESAKGALDQSQSPQQLKDNLIRVQNIYLDIVHGPGNGPPRKRPSFEQGAARPSQSQANPQIFGQGTPPLQGTTTGGVQWSIVP